MRIPTWRLALTGAAIAILAVAGLGLAAASTTPAAPAANQAMAEATRNPGAGAGAGERPGARLLRAGRHLVHAELTVTDRDGNLVHVQLDHGTVQSIGNGTLTIAEAGGGTETVSTDAKTNVYLGRKDGTLGDVKVGAEVFVRSRVDGGTPLAKRIIVIPPGT